MAKDSIKLSPKHGVNPTIPMCFWCGKEKNEIALMGKIDKKDSEAPRKVIIDYEPCEKCKAIFEKGIHVIGVTNTPVVSGMFPIVDSEDESKRLYPTGSMFVGTEDWAKRFLTANNCEEMIDDVLNKKALLMPDNVVEECVKDIQENTNGAVPDLDVEVPDGGTNESDGK